MSEDLLEPEPAARVIRQLCALSDGETSTHVARTWIVLALRMQLPLPDAGVNLPFHVHSCVSESEVCDASSCRAILTFLRPEPTRNFQLASVLRSFGTALDWLAATPIDLKELRVLGGRVRDWFLIAGFPDPEPGDPHFEREQGDLPGAAIDLIAPSLRHFSITTGASIPALTYETLWPVYLSVREAADGTFDEATITVVSDDMGGPQPANDAALVEAARLMPWTHWDPVLTVLELTASATSDFEMTGDHFGVVLKAATASELLLKHLAWMLRWEATGTISKTQLRMTSAEVVDKLLCPCLGPTWNRKLDGPLRSWDKEIRELRNDIVHDGRRVSRDAAGAALTALAMLLVAAQQALVEVVGTYPWTTLNWATKALWESGAMETTRAVIAGDGELDQVMRERLNEYRQAIDPEVAAQPPTV